MSHTKGKWETVYVSGVCIGGGIRKQSRIGTVHEMKFNTIIPDSEEFETTKELYKLLEEDAEFICKACNSHEKIVGILKQVKVAINCKTTIMTKSMLDDNIENLLKELE